MARTIRCLLGAGLCLLLAGPNFGAVAASDKYANIHTIGIISAAGESLTLKKIGFIVFLNSDTPVPISDWGLDGRITQEIGSALSSRFAIKPVTFDATDIGDVHRGFLLGWSEIDWKKHIKTMATDGVDAYIVVCPAMVQDPISQTNQWFRGIGLYGNSVYAFYDVIVVDARSGDTIDSALALLPQKKWLGLNYKVPVETTDDALWPDDSAAFSPDQKQKLKSIVETLVDDSINHALADLDLIDESLKLVPASPPAMVPSVPAPAAAASSPSQPTP